MNVKSLLADLEIDILTEDRVNYNGLCRLHDDDDPSFSINKDNGLWICRAGCGSGNAIHLILRIIGCSWDDAKVRYEKYSDPKSEITAVLQHKEERFSAIRESIFYPPTISLPKGFKSFIPHHYGVYENPYFKYLNARITGPSISVFKMGYCDEGRYSNRVIIPIVMKKQLVGFIARSIDSSQKRYLNATNVLYTHLLFNYDVPLSEDKTIFLCESTFDAITLYEMGIPSMATFGARISYRQAELLVMKGIRKLVFAFHNDKAGNEGVAEKLEFLSKLFSVNRLVLPENSDINELGHQDYKNFKIDTLIGDDVVRMLQSLKWKILKS